MEKDFAAKFINLIKVAGTLTKVQALPQIPFLKNLFA